MCKAQPFTLRTLVLNMFLMCKCDVKAKLKMKILAAFFSFLWFLFQQTKTYTVTSFFPLWKKKKEVSGLCEIGAHKHGLSVSPQQSFIHDFFTVHLCLHWWDKSQKRTSFNFSCTVNYSARSVYKRFFFFPRSWTVFFSTKKNQAISIFHSCLLQVLYNSKTIL